MDYEQLMQATKAAAEKRIRDEFQRNHPHYTPPPYAGALEWGAWVGANLKLHGAAGFRARFPEHAAVLEADPDADLGPLVPRLRALSYGENF